MSSLLGQYKMHLKNNVQIMEYSLTPENLRVYALSSGIIAGTTFLLGLSPIKSLAFVHIAGVVSIITLPLFSMAVMNNSLQNSYLANSIAKIMHVATFIGISKMIMGLFIERMSWRHIALLCTITLCSIHVARVIVHDFELSNSFFSKGQRQFQTGKTIR